MKNRFTLTHEDSIRIARGQGYRLIRSKLAPLVFLVRGNKEGTVSVIALREGRGKPDWHYRFSTPARAERCVADHVETVRASLDYRKKCADEKKAKRAALRASDHYQIGDVLYDSWGYDQTNIDWYQVTEVKAKSIVIRPIRGISSDHGGPTGGKTQPRRYEFCGEPQLKPLDENGRISSRHGCFSLWTGRAVYTSSYH